MHSGRFKRYANLVICLVGMCNWLAAILFYENLKPSDRTLQAALSKFPSRPYHLICHP